MISAIIIEVFDCTLCNLLQNEANESEDKSPTAENKETLAVSSLVSQVLNAAHTNVDDGTSEVSEPTQPSEQLNSQAENPDNKHHENNLTAEEPEPKGDKPLLNQVTNFQKRKMSTDSPSTESRKKLGFTGTSAFAPIQSKQLTLDDKTAEMQIDQCAIETDINKKSTTKDEGLVEDTSNEQSENLTSQLSEVSNRFYDIVRVAHLIEKALRSSLNDVTFEK